jgi:phosphohistidine phosphatase
VSEQRTRILWLLRHAKSDWSTGAIDHDRPLNPRGRADAYAAGRLLADRGWRPELVLCSSATRTRQTWQRAQEGGAEASEVRIEPGIYEASADELAGIVRAVDPVVSGLMLIGHGPGLPALAERLGRRPEPDEAWRRMDEKYPTCGLAVLGFDLPWAEVGLTGGRGDLIAFEVPRA